MAVVEETKVETDYITLMASAKGDVSALNNLLVTLAADKSLGALQRQRFTNQVKTFIDGARRRGKHVSRAMRAAIRTRDGNTCRYCGTWTHDVDYVIDHVIPVLLGGTNSEDNLVVSCSLCNIHKGAKTPQQAEMVLR